MREIERNRETETNVQLKMRIEDKDGGVGINRWREASKLPQSCPICHASCFLFKGQRSLAWDKVIPGAQSNCH